MGRFVFHKVLSRLDLCSAGAWENHFQLSPTSPICLALILVFNLKLGDSINECWYRRRFDEQRWDHQDKVKRAGDDWLVVYRWWNILKTTNPRWFQNLMRTRKYEKKKNRETETKRGNVAAVKGVSMGKYSWRCQKAQEIRKACGLSSLQLSKGSLPSITAHLVTRSISYIQSMTRSSSGITYCLTQCCIQGEKKKKNLENLSHCSHNIFRHYTRHAEHLYCSRTVVSSTKSNSYFQEKCWGIMGTQKCSHEFRCLPRTGRPATAQATSINGLGKEGFGGWGGQHPRTCATELQCSLAATWDFSGKTTVSAALHKSGLCGRVSRWQ